MAEPSNAANAGAPKRIGVAALAAAMGQAAALSAAELDARDQSKGRPRRMAGPPLAAGITAQASAAMDAASLPPPTDPQ